jgi:hypothetical protein
MHVAPVDLRSLRQGGLTLRFAMLGDGVRVRRAAADRIGRTSLETPCTRAHWGFVIEGN